MTAIAGLVHHGTVWIGGDSAGVYGQNIAVRADAKVFTRGPFLFGFTTSFRMGQLIRYTLDAPAIDPDKDLGEYMCTGFSDALRECFKHGGWARKDNEQESGGNFLVGVHGRLFEVFSDYQVGERQEPYTATGCGENFALGSLHTTAPLGWSPEQRLIAALQAAERFSTGVCGPFRILSAPH